MLETVFKGLFDTQAAATIEISDFLFCLGASLLAGLLMAFSYTFKSRYTKSFLVTLAILPAVVCVVIMMVNGNIGTGVAVAGAFSLVRFRSAPGSAKEITMIFLAMGAGLIAGMGYLAFSLLFALILCLLVIIYNAVSARLPESKREAKCKTLKITIPEDLDYTDVFEPLLSSYTVRHELVRVKSTNMGSMFRLTYEIELRDLSKEKELIDRLRERNGNLEIMVSRQETPSGQL